MAKTEAEKTQQREAKRAKNAAAMRAYRAAHPEYADYMRRWRAENADHRRAYQRKWYFEHRDSQVAGAMQWNRDHRLDYALHRKVAAAHARYPGRITVDDIRALLERQGWVCHWCKKEITKMRDLTLEHLKPVNDPQHITIACLPCNAARLPLFGRTARRKKSDVG